MTSLTDKKTRKIPGAEGAPRGPISPARESLSWIRALASEWEDDRSSSDSSDDLPQTRTR